MTSQTLASKAATGPVSIKLDQITEAFLRWNRQCPARAPGQTDQEHAAAQADSFCDRLAEVVVESEETALG